MLTGFTFVVAYDRRLAQGAMSIGAFLWRRFLRLWPIILIGSFIGLLISFWATGYACEYYPESRLTMVKLFFVSLTMVPVRSMSALMNPMQPQTWTLLYIIYANILYVLILRHLKRWFLVAAIVLSLGFTIYATREYTALYEGWMNTDGHMIVSLARMFFPVLLGMFIARKGWRISFSGCGIFAAVILAYILFAPFEFGFVRATAGCLERATTGYMELGMLIVLMPLVVLLGAGGSIPEGRFAAFCRFMGKYSFPLYAIHHPFTSVLHNWISCNPAAPVSVHITCVFAYLVAIFALAYLAMLAADKLADFLKGVFK